MKCLAEFHLAEEDANKTGLARADAIPFLDACKAYPNIEVCGIMHREKVAEVIAFFRRYAAGTPRLEDYVKGFLCHYALDVTVHPLIRHAAHQEFLEAGRNENEAHLSIESCLDAWMLKQRGCTIQDYSCYRDLHISKDDQLLLAGMASL